MWVFKTEKERDQYFNDDGKPTEAGKELQNKMMPVSDELAKLGTSTTRYTDWVIQSKHPGWNYKRFPLNDL